jgi:hypothetical protein
MAKGAPKTVGAAPKAAASVAPKTLAPSAAIAAKGGQKTTAQPADSVGDICQLPDIAGFAH